MKRRNFLRNGSLTGLSLLSAKLPESDLFPLDHNTSESFKLSESTIDDLNKRMTSGLLTSRKITQMYLRRIEEKDKKGPGVNSVIEVNPDALSIADAMDAERRSGKVRGPLHGIPVLIKDNIDTADRMMTTAGSLAMAGNTSSKDAFVVQQLRKAGAVILGKTNLSEWANFRSTNSTSGWSSRGGQTRNPYVLGRNPSGSSSGSASSVSSNFCAVSIGTETDGSVISPASSCGIVGMKPTVGLVSRSGIIPISKTQDTAGPMARTVRDAAILLGAMAGRDEEDAATLQSNGKQIADYTQFLKADAIRGRRIGVEKRHLSGNHMVVPLYEKAIEAIRSLGAEIVEVELLKAVVPNGAGEFNVLLYEFKDGLNKYLSKSNASVRSLADVIAFNKEHGDNTMPWFRQELLELSQEKGGLDSQEYLDAVRKSTGAAKVIDDLMKEKQLDAIIGVSTGPAAMTDLLNGDYGNGFYFCQPAAMAGFPHVTVPMGFASELPVGLSFMSGAWQDGPLLGMAYAYEQATLHRKAPRFIQ